MISAVPLVITSLILLGILASRSEWLWLTVGIVGIFGPLALLLPYSLRLRRFGRGESIG